MSELKPCPFCGHKARIMQDKITKETYKPLIAVDNYSVGHNYKNRIIMYKVVCNKCKGMVGLYKSQKTAIESWNRRYDNGKEKSTD